MSAKNGGLPQLRARGLETELFTERYHRAFEEELVVVSKLVDAWCGVEPSAGPVRMALHRFAVHLHEHCDLQELTLFPPMNATIPARPLCTMSGSQTQRACLRQPRG